WRINGILQVFERWPELIWVRRAAAWVFFINLGVEMLFVGNDFEKDALVKHFRKQGLKDIDEVIAEEGRLVREANSRTGLIWGISLACGVLSYFFVPNIFISIIAYPLSFVFRVFGGYYLYLWVY